MEGEGTVAKSVETRDRFGSSVMLDLRLSFGTVTSQCLTFGLEEAVLVDAVVMVETICLSSANGYCTREGTIIQSFKIFFRCCPCFRD